MRDIPDEKVEWFRKKMKEKHGVEMDFASAKVRYRELLNLYWILSFKPPKEGEPPYDPPPSPWM